MREIFRLVGRMSLDGQAAVEQGLKNTDNRAKQVGDRMQSMGQGISSAGAAMTKFTAPIAAVGAGLLALATRTGNYADEILDLSAATGMSTDALQEWRAIADRAGVATDAVVQAQQALTRQMARTEGGSASLNHALGQIGLTFEELEEMTPDEQMLILMERLRGVEDEGERARIGTALLRNNYEQLAPILTMTAEEMDGVIQQTRESGELMSREALKQANQFREGLDELKSEFSGLFRTIAVEFMPVLTDQLLPVVREHVIPAIRRFAERIGELFRWFGDLDPRTQRMVMAFTGLAVAIGPLMFGLGKIISLVGGIISAAGTLFPVMGALAGAFAPFLVGGVIIAGIAAIISGVIQHRKQTRMLQEDVADLTEEQREQHRAWLQQQADWLEALAARAEQQGRAGAAARTEYAAWEERHKQFLERLEELDEMEKKEKEHQEAIEDSTIAVGNYEEAYEALTEAHNEYGEVFEEVLGKNIDLSEMTQEEILALWMEHYDELMAGIEDHEEKKREEEEETTEHLAQELDHRTALNRAYRLWQIRQRRGDFDDFSATEELKTGRTEAEIARREAAIRAERAEKTRQRRGDYDEFEEAETDKSQAYYDALFARSQAMNEYYDEKEQRRQEAVARTKYNQVQMGKLWNDYYRDREEEVEDYHKTAAEKAREYSNHVQEIWGRLNSIWQQVHENRMTRLDHWVEDKLDALERENLSEEERAEREKEIREEADERRREIERQQAIRERAAALFSIAINTARAIVEALPNVFLAAAIGVLGAAQAAVVMAQPLPQLDEGGFIQRDVVAQLHADEAVVPLRKDILSQIGEGIVANTPRAEASGGAKPRDLILEIDGRKLAKVLGVHLVDDIRQTAAIRSG